MRFNIFAVSTAGCVSRHIFKVIFLRSTVFLPSPQRYWYQPMRSGLEWLSPCRRQICLHPNAAAVPTMDLGLFDGRLTQQKEGATSPSPVKWATVKSVSLVVNLPSNVARRSYDEEVAQTSTVCVCDGDRIARRRKTF